MCRTSPRKSACLLAAVAYAAYHATVQSPRAERLERLEREVGLLRERKEIGPGDIKDLLGISRKYAIPLLEFFDARRVTARVGERRVLRGA